MAIQDKTTGRIIGQEFGEKNPAWKGGNASVSTIHEWIRNHFKPEPKCEICGCLNDGNKTFDWSNKDHTYKRIRSDWQHVCRGCHNSYDYLHNGRTKAYQLYKLKIAGKWSPISDACLECGRTNVKHKCGGKCSTCYGRRQTR